MLEQNISFKACAIEENRIRPNRFISFQHLRQSFVEHAYCSLEKYIFVFTKCSFFNETINNLYKIIVKHSGIICSSCLSVVLSVLFFPAVAT